MRKKRSWKKGLAIAGGVGLAVGGGVLGRRALSRRAGRAIAGQVVPEFRAIARSLGNPAPSLRYDAAAAAKNYRKTTGKRLRRAAAERRLTRMRGRKAGSHAYGAILRALQ